MELYLGKSEIRMVLIPSSQISLPTQPATTLRATRNGLVAEFPYGKFVRCRPRRAGDERLSTGQSHLDGSSPPGSKKRGCKKSP